MITPKVREAQRAACRIHGMEGTKEYRAWSDIKRRCGNPKHKAYSYYGGRGISVCSRWLESPIWFLVDMGPAPGTGRNCSIDRIDNSGNYEPGNCSWSTHREQCRNRRSNVTVQAFGESKILVEWVDATIHHVRICGSARDDHRTLPLCPPHHLIQHGPKISIEGLGKRKFEEMHGVDIEGRVAEYRALYLARRG